MTDGEAITMTTEAPQEGAPVWRRNEPESPCVSICMIHPTANICVGCGRTAEEIARWSSMESEERARLREELPDRFALLSDPANRPSRRRRRG